MVALHAVGTSKQTISKKRKYKKMELLLNVSKSIDAVVDEFSNAAVSVIAPGSDFRLQAPLDKCTKCGAIVWKEERVKGGKTKEPRYVLCCGDGAITLPFFREAPKKLRDLMDPSAVSPLAKRFKQHIRSFNSMFAMTSHGATLDCSVMDGRGPYTFRMHGRNYHAVGTLLPDKKNRPRYAQLYIYDTEHEIDNRYDSLDNKKEINDDERLMDKHIIEQLKEIFDGNNRYVKEFRKVRDWYEGNKGDEFVLKLIENRLSNNKMYSCPEGDEIAALMIGHEFDNADKRDIIVYHKSKHLQRIAETHPSYMPLQYPILFPYGEDGWHRCLYTLTPIKRRSKCKVTMREFFAYHLQQRAASRANILEGGRLLQELMVDAYGAIEEQRLRWVRNNQTQLRTDLYQGLCDALHRGDTNASSVGNKIILPSSFTGGPRYMLQNYQDAMAICSWAGIPDLFITFTCNPKWVEFDDFFSSVMHQKSSERPDIVARLFHIKYNLMIDELVKKKVFGDVIAHLSVIEFQKRGLPHAHILITLHERNKLKTMNEVDMVISAEIPDEFTHPDLHELVKKHMIHGPCGVHNPLSPCMKKGKCSKGFPKSYNDFTRIDCNGFPVYRRRMNGPTTIIRNVSIDSSWVIPYSPFLLYKFQSHINVEVSTHSRMIKYLFKYVHKGPDRATAFMKNHVIDKNDEIKCYLDTRYVSAAEAAWRIFEFSLHSRFPPVERLKYHLPNEQQVCFYENARVDYLVSAERSSKTMLTEWFVANRHYPPARNLLYTEFPDSFVWDKQNQTWKPRKRSFSIGRLPYAQPIAGERYYLRMLLNVVRGAMSFEHLRTVNGIVQPTFKAACASLGLLGDDNEWTIAMNEASSWSSPSQLRLLFAMFLLYCEVLDPGNLWQKHWRVLSEDYQHSFEKAKPGTEIQLTDEEIQSHALFDIEQILSHNGQSLKNYPGMPTTIMSPTTDIPNQLIYDELNYDGATLLNEVATLEAGLNSDQQQPYSAVLNSCAKESGGLFFVYGSGGTGKTYLWKTLIARLRSEKKIVLAVASSGIASLLLPGGRTAHSRFRIPINITEFSTCTIKRQSDLAQLIKQTSLVIWDEAPMTMRYAFDALDRTFKDIVGSDAKNPFSHKPFGGKTVVLGGDFRQILPVVPRGHREDIVAASLHRSPLWKCCKLFLLKKNMRLHHITDDPLLHDEAKCFANWILDIGDGKMDGIQTSDESHARWIPIPQDLLINESLGIDGLIDAVYPHIGIRFNDISYLSERAILAPRNEQVSTINDRILSFIPGEVYTYLSADEKMTTSSDTSEDQLLYTTEFLNCLNVCSLPSHSLKLKIGVPIILLRNINQSFGLCNGTRLVITRLALKVIEARIMTGSNIGAIVPIPRIKMFTDKGEFPFIMRRIQFPIKLAFAMTINKSQGQTLQYVGIFLPTPVFCHGQLYVAVSRATSRKSLKFLLGKQTDMPYNYTANIVYTEVLEAVMNQLESDTNNEMASKKSAADKGKAVEDDSIQDKITGDKGKKMLGGVFVDELHDDDDLTITEMAMITKNKGQPKTPLKIDAEPRRPRGIVIEKTSSPQNVATKSKKERKHRHKKHKKNSDDDLHQWLFQCHEDTQVSEVNTEHQVMVLTKFKDMTVPGSNYNTHLRVIRSWFGMLYGSESLPSIAFLALDGHAERREVVVPAMNASKWKDKIVEGEAYAVTTISVNIASQFSRLVEAPHQLTFTNETQMKRLVDSDLPRSPTYAFSKLRELPALLLTEDIVRDVIVVVVDIRPPLTRLKGNKVSKFVEVYITDETIFPRCSVITVWEEHFPANDILTKGFRKHFIMIATGLRPNEFRERYGFQTCVFTRFVCDPEYEPAARMLLKSVTDGAMHLAAVAMHSPQFSDIYYKNEPHVLTVEQFLDRVQEPPPHGQQFTYIVRATISRIFTEMQTTYRSCAICSKGMPNPENDRYGCPNSRCSNTSGKTTQRYKIRIEVRDNTSRIYLTLFDRSAQDLLYIPATSFEHMKSKYDGPSKIQALFSQITDRTCNFHIRYDDDAFKYGRKGTGNYTANSLDWFPRPFTPVQSLPSHHPPTAEQSSHHARTSDSLSSSSTSSDSTT